MLYGFPFMYSDLLYLYSHNKFLAMSKSTMKHPLEHERTEYPTYLDLVVIMVSACVVDS